MRVEKRFFAQVVSDHTCFDPPTYDISDPGHDPLGVVASDARINIGPHTKHIRIYQATTVHANGQTYPAGHKDVSKLYIGRRVHIDQALTYAQSLLDDAGNQSDIIQRSKVGALLLAKSEGTRSVLMTDDTEFKVLGRHDMVIDRDFVEQEPQTVKPTRKLAQHRPL